MCVDSRVINKIIVKNKYPIPRLDYMLDELYGSHVGYNQIRIKEGDKYKTTFKTKYGLYKSFGFTNATTLFVRLMNHALHSFIGKFLVVYFDDIIIYSKTLDEHVEHLYAVVIVLRENNCIKISESVDFVLNLFSKGISMDEKHKVDFVRKLHAKVRANIEKKNEQYASEEFDSRTNSFEDEGNDRDLSNKAKDPLCDIGGPMNMSKTKIMKHSLQASIVEIKKSLEQMSRPSCDLTKEDRSCHQHFREETSGNHKMKSVWIRLESRPEKWSSGVDYLVPTVGMVKRLRRFRLKCSRLRPNPDPFRESVYLKRLDHRESSFSSQVPILDIFNRSLFNNAVIAWLLAWPSRTGSCHFSDGEGGDLENMTFRVSSLWI
ncbi:hypothetical protein CR513_49727, partial [Mucuna pruriens]